MFKFQNEWSVQKLFGSLIGFCHSSSKSSLICLGFRNSDLGFNGRRPFDFRLRIFDFGILLKHEARMSKFEIISKS